MEEKTMSDYWRERAKEEERYHKSIRWRYVMTVDHPMGHCAEVLFSNDGENYKSLDGLTPSYFEDMGFVTASVAHYPLDSVIPYQIMANALEEKMAMLKLHCKYKEELCILSKFWHIACKLRRIKTSTFGSELELPEMVTYLANTDYPKIVKQFSGGGVI